MPKKGKKIEEIEVVATEVKKVQTFKVLKPFTVDKLYNIGESVNLTSEKQITYLLTHKFIKKWMN
jgi:hypothetical protein